MIVHLAARVHVIHETVASPEDEFYKINSLATKNLAEQAAQCGVKRFVFLSSIDELFCGYKRYKMTAKFWEKINKIPLLVTI